MGLNASNLQLYERAVKVMPGSQSNLKVPLAAKPVFMVKGEGSHF